MARFGRVITAMVTPFRQDGSLDVAEAQKVARHLVDHGSEGLVVAGSTGEGATLRDDERISLFRAVVDAVEGKAKVVCGTGTYSTEHSVELTREAEKAGADGVLVGAFEAALQCPAADEPVEVPQGGVCLDLCALVLDRHETFPPWAGNRAPTSAHHQDAMTKWGPCL